MIDGEKKINVGMYKCLIKFKILWSKIMFKYNI